MRNGTLILNRIACTAATLLLMAGSARADLVYSTDFDTTYASSNGTFFLGGADPDVATGDWFGSGNEGGISGGELTYANATQNRFRGTGVWLDTTGWAPGPVVVEIDVPNFVEGADTNFFFQAYAASGVDATSSVSLDLHGPASHDAEPTATGSATIGTLGAQQAITDSATQTFTFDFNGTDQHVALTFTQLNANNGTDFGSKVIDNLTVQTVPEPSLLALLVVGISIVGFRRRRGV